MRCINTPLALDSQGSRASLSPSAPKKKSINLLIKAEKLLDTFTIQSTSLAPAAKDNSQQLQTQR